MADEEARLTDEDLALINEAYEAEFKQYEGRVNENFQRIGQLIQMGGITEVQKAVAAALGSSAHDDVLRSAVVFMHATLEDVFRTISLNNLPVAKEEFLKSIPSKVKRRVKFDLEWLAAHGGKNVDDVIREAVEAELKRTNYNNASEVRDLLKAMEIDTTKLEEHFPALVAVMDRRHQIVHGADRQDLPGQALPPIEPIDRGQVADWGVALKKFLEALIRQVALKQVGAKIRAATQSPRE